MALFRSKRLTSLSKAFSLPELRKRTKILVIDDDVDAFPVQSLRNQGYTIEHWAEVQSMERLERGDFDIIILDIAGVARKLSPEEDGFAVLQHLKQHNPMQIIVAFSGQSFDLSKQEFFKLADDTLPKPVNTLKCRQILDELIESKMTVRHLWDTVSALMRAEGVTERKVAKLEKQLAKAIESARSPDVPDIVSGCVERGELALKVTAVVLKILALCGV